MNIGDKVKHQSGSFDFKGTLLACGVTSSGRRVWMVEQEGTCITMLFEEYSLNLISCGVRKLVVKRIRDDEPEEKPQTDLEWFDSIKPQPTQSTPELPHSVWVPIKARPGKRSGFRSEVRLYYLTAKPYSSLITCDLTAEVEFHFHSESSGDLDNLLKPTLDLLKGSVIYDDQQIKQIVAKVVPRSSREGFLVTLHEAKKG